MSVGTHLDPSNERLTNDILGFGKTLQAAAREAKRELKEIEVHGKVP